MTFDELIVEMHRAIHDQMQTYVDSPEGWTSDTARLIHQQLDAALALYIEYFGVGESEHEPGPVH